MPQTENDVKTWMLRLLEPTWPFDWVKLRYGIDLSHSPQSFLAQYRIWAETFREPQEEIAANGRINRFYMELFMQQRGYVGIRTAAVLLGMCEASFSKTLALAKEANFITEQEELGEFPGANVYRSSFIGDFYKRFPKLAKFTFSSYPSFCRRLHETIDVELGFKVAEALCLTSLKLREDPIDIGHDLDALTGEPVGLPFQVWLKTDKPIQLKPDICSWLTYALHEDLLKEYVETDMERDEVYQKRRDELK